MVISSVDTFEIGWCLYRSQVRTSATAFLESGRDIGGVSIRVILQVAGDRGLQPGETERVGGVAGSGHAGAEGDGFRVAGASQIIESPAAGVSERPAGATLS